MAVASLQSAGQLDIVARWLDSTFNGQTAEGIYVINMIVGLLSSIVDNVPLVAGAMGMYPIAEVGMYAADGMFWGVFGLLCRNRRVGIDYWFCSWSCSNGYFKIDFIWYIKNISLLALMGYLAGAATYILMQ